MALLRKGSGLPGAVRSGLGLTRGERVLAQARLVDGRWLVATTTALVIASEPGGTEPLRRGWDQIDSAVWADTASMLQITWVENHRQEVWEMAGSSGYLPEVVRERVEASVVVSRRIEVKARRGVKVAIRRSHPGGDLSAQVVPDRGVDIAEPDLAARIAGELADLREQAGLEGTGLPRLDSNQRPSD